MGAWASTAWAAGAWAGTAWEGGSSSTATAVVGGGIAPAATKKRRSVVIDGQVYVGTEAEIEALLNSLLDEDEPKPVKKKGKKSKPIQIEIDDPGPPERINMPVYRRLVKQSFRNDDPFLTFLLRQILTQQAMKKHLQDEEDLEAILLLL